MLGKRRPIIKFFDLFTKDPTDPEFGIFLAEVVNLVRQRKVVQLLIKVNSDRDGGYYGRRLRGFLEELRLSHEKFSVTPNGSEDSINFVCYTVGLKRKILGLFWI